MFKKLQKLHPKKYDHPLLFVELLFDKKISYILYINLLIFKLNLKSTKTSYLRRYNKFK